MDYRQRIYGRYAEVFKDQASSFDRAQTERWGRSYRTYLKGWLPREKDAAIADLACGSGNLLYVLQQWGYTNLSGVDTSPDQVALAQQVAPNVEEGDLLSFLGRYEDHFDVLTGLDIIEHLGKDEVLDFLDACYKALKPGGRLILQTPNADSPWMGRIRYGDFTHEVCFHEEVLGRLMKLCRYTSVEARELGPVPFGYSMKATVRYVLWQGVRAGIRLLHTIETGGPGSNVLTRVFMISGCKPG